MPRSTSASAVTPRFAFGFSTLFSIALVATAVWLAQTKNLAACPLCIWQRIWYLAVALFAAIGFLAAGSRAMVRLMAILVTIAAAFGIFVAGYQSYIQRFAVDTSCGAARWWERVVDALGERSPLLFGASGLCSDPGWRFLQLSLAEWSLLGFCLVAAIGLYLMGRRS